METVPERIVSLAEPPAGPDPKELARRKGAPPHADGATNGWGVRGQSADGSAGEDSGSSRGGASGREARHERSQRLLAQLRWPFAVYAVSRVVLLLLAFVDTALQHGSVSSELTNWDGIWYLKLAVSGYPTHVTHQYSTLGFFPLYSMTIWLLGHVLDCSYTIAGLLISVAGGFVATVLAQRLCTTWWGEATGRRAVVLFCVFPGSVVFSMVYSEGLLIPLAAGCLIALERRRFVLAGVLAGLATAVGPDALVLIPVCAVASVVEIYRKGWRDRAARSSLVAPLLAPVGLVAFGIFLWIWTGTPLASYDAQRYAWGERTDALALYRQARTLVSEISFSHFSYHSINLNLVAGLLGAVVLVIGIVFLLRREQLRLVPIEALLWTFGVGFLAVTSEYTPPNPRLLITAFPAVLVLAYVLKGHGYRWLIAVNTVLLITMSAITYVGIALRP